MESMRNRYSARRVVKEELPFGTGNSGNQYSAPRKNRHNKHSMSESEPRVRTNMIVWFQKLRINARKAAAELFAESSDSTEYRCSVLDPLFESETELSPCQKGTLEEQGLSRTNSHKNQIVEAQSNTSTTLVMKSEEEEFRTSKLMGQQQNNQYSNVDDSILVVEPPSSFSTFDARGKCEQLRKECESKNEPFTEGVKIWEIQRKLWNTKTDENTLVEAANHRSTFQRIKCQYHARIYKKLVVEEQPLNHPLNLEDVMKVMEAGWIEMDRWERTIKGLP